MDYIYEDSTVAKTNLSVNGVPFPPPAPEGVKIVRSQLVEGSERTASGMLVTNLVRDGVRHTQWKWNFLTVNEVTRMLDAIGNGLWLQIVYLDITNVWHSIVAYHGDISYTPHYVLETGLYDGATSVEFNIVQQ